MQIIRWIFVFVLICIGGRGVFADSVDYMGRVLPLFNDDIITDAALANDSVLITVNAEGKVVAFNKRNTASKEIWSAKHAISKIAVKDSLIALAGKDHFYLISNQGNLLFQISDERLSAVSIAVSDSEFILFSGSSVYCYNWITKSGAFERAGLGITRIYYSDGLYLLGYEDGFIEVRKKMSDPYPKRHRLHQNKVLYIDFFGGNFISGSSDSLKVWDSSFELIKSKSLLVGENVVSENNIMYWSNYDNTFYSYDLLTERLTTYYDPSALWEPIDIEEFDTIGNILFYDLRLDTLKTFLTPNQRVGAMALSRGHDSLLIANANGQLCVYDLESKGLKCDRSNRFYINPLFLSWNQPFYAIGNSGCCKVSTRSDKPTTLLEMAYGFVAFNGAHFKSNNEYVAITVSSNAVSYLIVGELSDLFPSKRKKGGKGKPIQWRLCSDSMPIRASLLIPGSDILVFSRGKELIFFDCITYTVTKRLSVERPVTSFFYNPTMGNLIIGDEGGFIRFFSPGRDQWLSEYKKLSPGAIISVASTRFQDTVVVSSLNEIVIIYPDGESKRLNYPQGVTRVIYSEILGGLVYSTPNPGRKNYYEWSVGNKPNSIPRDIRVVGLFKVIPGVDELFLLTPSDMYKFAP